MSLSAVFVVLVESDVMSVPHNRHDWMMCRAKVRKNRPQSEKTEGSLFGSVIFLEFLDLRSKNIYFLQIIPTEIKGTQ